MRVVPVFLVLVSISALAAPAPKSAAPALPSLLKDVETKYTRASTLVADFTETSESAALKQTKKNSGTIQFKRPGKIRWETLKPDHNLLISDGKKFWFYTPPFDPTDPEDKGQYWERDASKVQSRFAQALLSGSFSEQFKKHAMSVKQTAPSDFLVTPKKGTAATVQQATLHIDPKQKLITGISLVHRGGNKSEIKLSNIRLGQPLEDSLFHFTPPANAEKLEER